MKIAYLALGNSPHSLKWANSLSQIKGFELHLITQDPPLPDLSQNVVIHQLPYVGKKGYFLNSLALKKVLKKIQPDLLHSNFASGYGTLATLTGFKPHLLSVWGSDVYDFPFKNKFNYWLITHNLSRAQAIASTSKAMLLHTKNLTNTNIFQTPFGVNTEEFKPTAIKQNSSSFKIGLAKGLHKIYGHEILIFAFKKFIDLLPIAESTFCFLEFAGDGPELENLKKLTKNLKLENYVRFYGNLSHSKIPSFLVNLDVIVNPSYNESFGVAALEASSCEKPVIASNVGGLPEVVLHNKTGFLVEPGDIEDLTTKIFKLYKSTALRRSMGIAGRKFVIDNYDHKICVEKLCELYKKIAMQHKHTLKSLRL